MEQTYSNISLEDDLQNGNEEKRSMEETELESVARLFESRKVPPCITSLNFVLSS